MKGLNERKVALTFGLFISGWHVLWSLLVLLAVAQPILNFVFWMHMLANPFTVTGFTFLQALTLVVVTFLFGCAIGWVFAWLWNRLHR
ncbi:MAG: hypothetical protein M1150_00420 [Patescibacteria group bacterium]|nr:hypothetical protein [Patescibacteria group bacterium]